MQSSFQTPFDKSGNPQAELHGRTYQPVSGDLHHKTDNSRQGNPRGGLLCQDCHTSIDVHGDGNIHGTTLAQVEIECTDCHGTPDMLPWELPLGYKDEFAKPGPFETPRGVTHQNLLSARQFGFNYDSRDGFLLTARGNPMGNVVKAGDTVIVHSAKGVDFTVPLLRQIKIKKTWHSASAQIAMSSVSAHLKRMECYTCHAAWAPQSYGRYIKVDYQNTNLSKTDWVASGNSRMKNGQTAESKRGAKGILSPGMVEEQPGFLRWEDPVLGINGEGQVSPLIPGSQVIYTVVGTTGSPLVSNQIASSMAEALSLGQDHIPLSPDTTPAQPHTSQRKARSCENCHTNPKTAGLGMGGKDFFAPAFDWSRIVTEKGEQLVTVGSHWPLSRAFDRDMLDKFLKTGTCMGCHMDMDNTEFWQKVSTKGTLDSLKHQEFMHQILKKMTQADQVRVPTKD